MNDLKFLKEKSQTSADVQQPTVSGRVTDANGNPIAGVTISVAGTTIGTITDIDGKYSISGAPPDAVLKFSFIGMITQDVKVEKKTGESLGNTTLVNGIVLDKEIVHSGMPKRIEKAKIALLDTSLENDKGGNMIWQKENSTKRFCPTMNFGIVEAS